MHHNTLFYDDSAALRLLSEGARYANVFILPGWDQGQDRHIFGVASYRRQTQEKFRKELPAYRLVIKLKRNEKRHVPRT